MTTIIEKVLIPYDTYPWLYDKTSPNISPNDYILQLNKKSNSSFLRYTCPCVFLATALDDFKDKLLWSFSGESNSGIALISFIEYNKDTILDVSVGKPDDNTPIIFSCAIHTNNPKNFFEFLKKYQDYRYDKDKKMGFI